MSIEIKSNCPSFLELGLNDTLSPGATVSVPNMTPRVLNALDQGLAISPDGAESPDGIPPVIFENTFQAVLPVAAARAYYIRVLCSPAGFHDGDSLRDFLAYYADGAGMSCAFSDDGIHWDHEKEVTGIAANGYHVVCAQEAPDRLRILYWDPDVPNTPYNMAGLRTAVCNPLSNPAAFTGDVVCAGNLVTGGSQSVWNRGHYGPAFLWHNPNPESAPGKPFTWRWAMLFIASTGGNDSLGLGCSDDAVNWNLFGNGPVLSGLIAPQSWEGPNGYVAACHVERMPDGRWWMLYSGGAAGNAGIGYAFSWDRIHWEKADFNPVFKAGVGAFSTRCYTPTMAQCSDGSYLLFRCGRDATNYRVFVSRLRSLSPDVWRTFGSDRLGQGLSTRENIVRGRGTAVERDAAIIAPALGDEWFNTASSAWEKYNGAAWAAV